MRPPRDAEEREYAVEAWGMGRRNERGIPEPVEMPTLAHPWRRLESDGDICSLGFKGAAAASEFFPNSTIVRLAVVEVVESEPEAAPSGWRYRGEPRRPDLYTLVLDRGEGGEVFWTHRAGMSNADGWKQFVPPIDRDLVAALLAKAGT